jgi:molybdopterin-guanine dinucleotide biosynthesis protein A
MGRDKSRLRLGGRTMLERIRLQAKHADLPVRVVRRDLAPRCGPLGGIHTALIRTRAEAVVFLACDMPFVTVDLIKWLLKQCEKLKEREKGEMPQAVFLRSKGKPGFPLVVGRGGLGVVKKQIETGVFSVQLLAARRDSLILRAPRRFWPQFRNVNTPAEWERAQRVWRRGRS